jgi:ABC-2 type transport system permease protein/sodium transport system permease protein
MGRVRLASAFRLRRASPAAWLAALLLGLCLWPFAHEALLLLRQWGLTTLRPEQLEKSREMLELWRGVPAVLVVLAMAVTPAVFEELFFRGYLFSALLGEDEHPVRAIVGTAVLFAVFHLLVGGVLTVERLVPSLLMGLVLGWLAYRSGSVLPGVVLHTIHNALLVLMGYYQPLLTEKGWMPDVDDHLPAWLLGAAGVGAVVGLAWLSRLQRTASSAPGSAGPTRG